MEEQEAFLDVFGMAWISYAGRGEVGRCAHVGSERISGKDGRISVLKYLQRRPGQHWATAQLSAVLPRSTERGDAWG